MNAQRFADGIFDAGAWIESAMRILKHHLHVLAGGAKLAAVQCQPIVASEKNRAFVGRDQSHENARKRGFSAAGGTGKSQRLTGPKRKRDVGERRHPSCAGAVGLGQAVDGEQGIVHDAASLTSGGVDRSR